MLWPIAGSDLGKQSTTCIQDIATPLAYPYYPIMVLEKYFAKLVASIQSPSMLAAFLYADHVINYKTKQLVTTSIKPVSERSFMLLNPMRSTLTAAWDSNDVMLSLCTALEKSGELAVGKVAADIRIWITGKCPRPPLLEIMKSLNALAHCRK